MIECSLRHRDGTWLQFEVQHTDLLQDEHVRGIVLNSRDVSERKAFEDQLAHQAFHDPVTSLANRALFADRVQHSIMRSIRGGPAIGVMFIDLDDFKTVNDSLGHAAGDTVLQEVGAAPARRRAAGRHGRALRRRRVRRPPRRHQGLRGGRRRRRPHPARARAPVRRRRQAGLPARERRHLPRRPRARARPTPRSSSATPTSPCTWPSATARAATASSSRRCTSASSSASSSRPSCSARSSSSQLEIHYQPVVRLDERGDYGVEALLRWMHPTRGTIPPLNFIPLAEETGLIVPIGRWVLQEACRQGVRLHERFPRNPPLTISVNLSVKQLQSETIIDDVRDALEIERPAAVGPRPRDHRDGDDGRHRPRGAAAARAEGARRPARDGRLRHRLLVALLPAAASRSTSSRWTARSSRPSTTTRASRRRSSRSATASTSTSSPRASSCPSRSRRCAISAASSARASCSPSR